VAQGFTNNFGSFGAIVMGFKQAQLGFELNKWDFNYQQ
jgi:hypothetical protein